MHKQLLMQFINMKKYKFILNDMRYYIYVYWQQGNVGTHQVKLLDEQPLEGFKTDKHAESHLEKLIERRKGYYFERPWYEFTIQKTWKSKNALDKKK